MSARTLRIVFVSLALVSGSLAVCTTLGLTTLAALPEDVASRIPIWGVMAPLMAGVITGLMVLLGIRRARGDAGSAQLANLPGHALLVFLLVGGVGSLAGAALEPHPLVELRPYIVLFGGPVLVVAHAMILRAVILPPWTSELTRRAARPSRGATDGRNHARGRTKVKAGGVLAISPTLTLFASVAVIVALTLIGLRVHSSTLAREEEQARIHLRDLLQVVEAQVKHLPSWKVTSFLEGYPVSAYGAPVVTAPTGKTLSESPGLPRGTELEIAPGGCRHEERTVPCAVGGTLSGPDRRRLVVVRSPGTETPNAALAAFGSHLLLVVLGFFLFAALLGRAIGNDISRDFLQITNQVRAMARQSELDLGRPVTVTSIDEVGDLTSHLGKLRTRLETEHEQYRDALRATREADRIRNEFFSDVSRELRTPLTTLCGYSQLLLEETAGPLSEGQREDVESIHRGGLQLLGLVNDVLDISVIESGFLKLNPERVDVGALCEEIVRGQRVALETADKRRAAVELGLELEPGLPLINADPRRLQQVVQNLLSNALKFTEEGQVTVRVRQRTVPPRGIVIEVEDSGLGIGHSDLPKVFDHYQQAGDLTLRRKGSGLGLAISKHLVELHGGEISVESEAGQGSTFTVVLPLDAIASSSGRHLARPEQEARS